MAEEKQKLQDKEAVDELDTNLGTKRSWSQSSAMEMTVDGMRCALANFLSDCEAQYKCNITGKMPFLYQFGKYMMDWLLESTTIKWFKNKNDELCKSEKQSCAFMESWTALCVALLPPRRSSKLLPCFAKTLL